MDNKEKVPAFEKKESAPKPIFKVILMRHEETLYSGVGHDLTDSGVRGAEETGRKMKEDNFFPDKSKVVTLHSPSPRAKGTLEFTAKQAGIPTENSRPIRILRPSDIFDARAFAEHTDVEMQDDPGKIDEAFYTHDIHKNHPEIVEPNWKKKKRLYRAMEYLIRFVAKHKNEQDPSVQQIFAVSHFGMITHLIDDVFGIENTGYRSPVFGEQIKISAFQTKDPDKILLKVGFREFEKEAIFNRKTRSIEQISE